MDRSSAHQSWPKKKTTTKKGPLAVYPPRTIVSNVNEAPGFKVSTVIVKFWFN
jgi:hypothetical protein